MLLPNTGFDQSKVAVKAAIKLMFCHRVSHNPKTSFSTPKSPLFSKSCRTKVWMMISSIQLNKTSLTLSRTIATKKLMTPVACFTICTSSWEKSRVLIMTQSEDVVTSVLKTFAMMSSSLKLSHSLTGRIWRESTDVFIDSILFVCTEIGLWRDMLTRTSLATRCRIK